MKVVSLLLGTLLVYQPVVRAAPAATASGTTQVQTQETPQPAKVKAKVQKRGKSRVRVELLNGTEVKGDISKIEEASFTVTDKKTGQVTTILYADVQKIRGPGWSKADTIVVSAVGAGLLVLVILGLQISR